MLRYQFLTLSVLILYSRFPTYPQISNLFRATAIFKYQINSVCLITTVKSFPPSTFIDFFGTMTWTDFCMFSHALQHGLLRSEYCITLQSVPYRPPQLRCVIFPSTYLPHLPNISSDSYWASVCMATLPDMSSLICDFCSSDRDFAIDFFQIPPHDGHPCHSLTVRHYQALYGTFTHKLLPMLGTL